MGCRHFHYVNKIDEILHVQYEMAPSDFNSRLQHTSVAMNAYPVSCSILLLLIALIQIRQNGTRIFFWDLNGAIKYGTVVSTSRMTDVSLLYLDIQQ